MYKSDMSTCQMLAMRVLTKTLSIPWYFGGYALVTNRCGKTGSLEDSTYGCGLAPQDDLVNVGVSKSHCP